MALTMGSPTRSANRTLSWPSVTFTVYCRLTAVYVPASRARSSAGIASWPSTMTSKTRLPSRMLRVSAKPSSTVYVPLGTWSNRYSSIFSRACLNSSCSVVPWIGLLLVVVLVLVPT